MRTARGHRPVLAVTPAAGGHPDAVAALVARRGPPLGNSRQHWRAQRASAGLAIPAHCFMCIDHDHPGPRPRAPKGRGLGVGPPAFGKDLLIWQGPPD